jgi:hypothetical protein
VMYPAKGYNALGHGIEKFALVNPVATMLTQMGHAFIGGSAYPSARTAAGGVGPVIAALALIPAIFALGYCVFTREAPRVAENL